MPDQAESLAPLIGREFSHYRIIEEIGSGGMGVVFRAHDQHLEREVAIKVLHPGTVADEGARRHLHKEALALSKLNHPNIATIHDFDTQRGMDFLVMEYIPGVTLNDKLAGGPLPENEVLRLGMQLSEGLAAAHEQGVVHRDLKPGNLRLARDGRLKILDFGLAKLRQPPTGIAAAETTLQSQAISGTFAYMAPEQLMGEELDARTDIHGAGLVLYEMATGQRPFAEVQSNQLIGAILRRPPDNPRTLNSKISPELGRIIGKCLQKEPENRYQTAKELATDLQRLKQELGSGRAGVGRTETGWKHAPITTWFRWAVVAGATVLVVGLAMVGWLFHSRKAHALTDKDTIVVAEFTNTTGDPVFDGTLRQGLTVQLEQSPFLSILSDQRIQQTLRLMEKPKDASLTPEISREVCERTGSTAVIDGSIAQIGTRYSLILKAVGCTNGESFASTEVEASDKSHVLDALGQVSSEIRKKLGESLSMVQRFDTPISDATTPSLEALQAYSLGRKTLAKGDSAAAVHLFQQAIRLDPNFAMAYVALAASYSNVGEIRLGQESAQKAYELRERVSEREKLYIECRYYAQATGDVERARQCYELYAHIYSRDAGPHNILGTIYAGLGQWDKALEQAREALRLEENAINYSNVFNDYLSLDRLGEAQTTAIEAQGKKLDSSLLHFDLYSLAFLQNDAAGIKRQVEWATGKQPEEEMMVFLEADTAAYSGRLKKAREFSRRAVASAERAKRKEPAASYEAGAAVREALLGNAAKAQQRATAALALSVGRYVQCDAARALAFAGYSAQAQALADDLAKRFPEHTFVRFTCLPEIRAELSLSRNDPTEAIELLQAVVPYELGARAALLPAYVRGEAYLATHQGTEAAAEFQKILDHPGLLGNFLIGALTHLQIGRAYAMQGDTAKAKAAYQDFLTLWKDADPDVPILIAAKAEYAKLK